MFRLGEPGTGGTGRASASHLLYSSEVRAALDHMRESVLRPFLDRQPPSKDDRADLLAAARAANVASTATMLPLAGYHEVAAVTPAPREGWDALRRVQNPQNVAGDTSEVNRARIAALAAKSGLPAVGPPPAPREVAPAFGAEVPPAQFMRVDVQGCREWDTLAVAQKQAVQPLIDYLVAWRKRMDSGRPADFAPPPNAPRIFITGGPGTGKSHVGHVTAQVAAALASARMLAFSHMGCAAVIAGGSTTDGMWYLYEKIVPGRREGRRRRDEVRKLSPEEHSALEARLSLDDGPIFLWLAEASMTTAEQLAQVDVRCQCIMKSNARFGGLPIVVDGDFAQIITGFGTSLPAASMRDIERRSRLAPLSATAQAHQALQRDLPLLAQRGKDLMQSFSVFHLTVQQRAGADIERQAAIDRRRNFNGDPPITPVDTQSYMQRVFNGSLIRSHADALAWARAPLLVAGNLACNELQLDRAVQLARLTGTVVFRWPKPCSGTYYEGLTAAQRFELLDTCPALWEYYVPGGRTMFIQNVRLAHHAGYVNGSIADGYGFPVWTVDGADDYGNNFYGENGRIDNQYVEKARNAAPGTIITCQTQPAMTFHELRKAPPQWQNEFSVVQGRIVLPAVRVNNPVDIKLPDGNVVRTYPLTAACALVTTIDKSQGATEQRIIAGFNKLPAAFGRLDVPRVFVAETRTTSSQNMAVLPPPHRGNFGHLLKLKRSPQMLAYMAGWVTDGRPSGPNNEPSNRTWSADAARAAYARIVDAEFDALARKRAVAVRGRGALAALNTFIIN